MSDNQFEARCINNNSDVDPEDSHRLVIGGIATAEWVTVDIKGEDEAAAMLLSAEDAVALRDWLDRHIVGSKATFVGLR